MRVFFLLSLYLNKAIAQISFLIPNIDICEGMNEEDILSRLGRNKDDSGAQG